ncbi:probable carboxylesterase 15 [Manihot esculenta]|nr:probable carboxylesterase 15 [Manihot esculenta]
MLTHTPLVKTRLLLSVNMVHQIKLVDEVSGWLRRYDDGSVDRTWTGPPQVKFMADPVPAHQDFIDGIATRDVTIHENSGLRVRIYLPEPNPEDFHKLPVILHFHGGGFCISQADWFMYYHIYTRFAKSLHAICVSVYLRPAPEHRLPAACDDGFSALLWLRSLAQGRSSEPWLNDYADFNRVFLIGDSSGGNIVHEVAARAGQVDLSPLRLAGGIPVHPGFVRSTRSKSEMEQPESPFLTLDMVDKFLGLALPIGCNKDHPITCPMGAAAPSLDSLNLPPVLLCVAEMDLIKDTEMEYYEAMKKANKDVELLISRGMGHSFYLNKLALDMDYHTAEQTTALIEGIKDFIHKH